MRGDLCGASHDSRLSSRAAYYEDGNPGGPCWIDGFEFTFRDLFYVSMRDTVFSQLHAMLEVRLTLEFCQSALLSLTCHSLGSISRSCIAKRDME